MSLRYEFSTVDALLNEAAARLTPAAQLVIRHDSCLVYARNAGYLDPEAQELPTQSNSIFDLASLTKLFTATAFMRLVEEGQVTLDQPVCTILSLFRGPRPILPYEDPLKPGSYVDVSGQEHRGREIPVVGAGLVTFRQILRHSSGLPAWRAFKDQPDADAARRLALDTFFSYQPDSRALYSDVGLILLGMAVEELTGHPLDYAIRKLVTEPLGLLQTRFLPIGTTMPLDTAPTEFCKWRGRRIIGEVHDESAARLGGIAGHAGLFSSADDVARFGQSFLPQSHADGEPVKLLQPDTIAEMTRLQFAYNTVRRGLGFALWSPDPEASSHPFGPRTFGHTGFTGTSLWIDPDRRLVVALLTNDVYYGREGRSILSLRLEVHKAIVQAVDMAVGAKAV